jgi:hypothetical protein
LYSIKVVVLPAVAVDFEYTVLAIFAKKLSGN